MTREAMISERPLTREQLYQLDRDMKQAQEPYIKLLVDLYAVSIPKITFADGIVTTEYSPEVEENAAKIRSEMMKAIEMVVRYRNERWGRL